MTPPFYQPVRALPDGDFGVSTRRTAFTTGESAPRARGFRVSRAALYWFLMALGVRLVAGIVIHLYSLASGYGGFYPLASGADDVTYWDLTQRIYAGLDVPFVANDYPFVLARFYHLVGGPDLFVGKLLNIFAGALTVWFGVLLVQELTRKGFAVEARRRAVRWAGLLLTFYPSLLWYSTQLVKDPLLVLAGMAALYFQVCLLRRFQPLLVVGWLVSFAGLFPFRPYAAAALALSLLIYMLRFKPKWLVPAFVIMAVLPYLLGKGWFGLASIQNVAVNADTIAQFRQSSYSIGGSSAGITINYSNPILFLLTYSYSFVTAMFGPFPWQIKAVGQAVALPEAMMMWALFPVWLRGVRDLRRRVKPGTGTSSRREVALLLFSLVLIGVIAVFSDNIGANTRLRLLPWSAFLLYASLKMPRFKRLR
jgi:hypothetical protein